MLSTPMLSRHYSCQLAIHFSEIMVKKWMAPTGITQLVLMCCNGLLTKKIIKDLSMLVMIPYLNSQQELSHHLSLDHGTRIRQPKLLAKINSVLLSILQSKSGGKTSNKRHFLVSNFMLSTKQLLITIPNK